MKRKPKYRFPPAPAGGSLPSRPVSSPPGTVAPLPGDFAGLAALSPEVLAGLTLDLKRPPRSGTTIQAPSPQSDAGVDADLPQARRMLAAQAATLDLLFHHLAQTALSAKIPPEHSLRYARLALKAQTQSAHAVRTLSQLGQAPRMAACRPGQLQKQATASASPGKPASPQPLIPPAARQETFAHPGPPAPSLQPSPRQAA